MATETFSTGAIRDTAGNKPRMTLISPLALVRLGHWLREGGKRYGDRNWEKGIPMERSLDSLLRHCADYMAGKRSEDALAAIFCNAMFLVHTDEMIKRGRLPEELAYPVEYQVRQSGPTVADKPIQYSQVPEDCTGRTCCVYLAGPMRGIPKHNFPAFFKAETELRLRGYDVINPARLDLELDGFDGVGIPPHDEDYYMERDFRAMADCDHMVLLPGWEKSKGVEREIAHFSLVLKRGRKIKPYFAFLSNDA